MRKIDPVGLRDIAGMFPQNITYGSLQQYRKRRTMPDPAGYVNNVSDRARVPVWDRGDIIAWGVNKKGWTLV